MISKVLVANRGEIARRIFRTCRAMGMATVAIHSDVDALEPHVSDADEAIRLEGETPAETYLDIDSVVAAAKESGADAVHPGYGFLAENAGFARAVIGAGLIWVGPSPAAIEVMGSKLESKRLVTRAGVPTLPAVTLEAGVEPVAVARDLEMPLLVKASAGGGGKGMRVVRRIDDLAEAVDGARREAASAFGDDTIFLERYLPAPRHIEIQVFGDASGRVVSLYERECSIQRRHQKIIEEAPSLALDETTRRDMGEAAVAVASAVGYLGAGTVEFLYQGGQFWFLEMNTRLQVEHPVTEMVTGLDLVRLQLEVADGGLLPAKLPPIEGHAIEARLYAEDPLNDFLPVTGVFHRFDIPDDDGLRVEAGIEAGSTVTVHYDPMIAKVIAHASTREVAAQLLASGLRRSRIHGSTTNRALLVRILEHPEFVGGDIDTHFLERHDVIALARPLLDEAEERLAALAAALSDQAAERAAARVLASIPSGWRNLHSQPQRRSYVGDHGIHDIAYSVGRPFELDGWGTIEVDEATAEGVVLVAGGARREFVVSRYDELRYVDSERGPARLGVVSRFPDTDLEDDSGSLHAPMPGRVIRVTVDVGDRVADGDPMVVLEAMKMEHTLRAPHHGEVTQVLCSAGDQVEAGAVLVVVEES